MNGLLNNYAIKTKKFQVFQTSTSFKCNRFHIDFEYLFFHEIENHQNHQ